MRKFLLLVCAMLFVNLFVFSKAYANTNVCNYWFLYIYNQHGSDISYNLTSSDSGGIYGPSGSGTISNGSNAYIYFGNQNTGEDVYTGGKVMITDANGNTIGTITASGSDSGGDAGCFFDSYMTIQSGYKACAFTSQQANPGPCTECAEMEAEASGDGSGTDSTTAGSPNAAYTICSS